MTRFVEKPLITHIDLEAQLAKLPTNDEVNAIAATLRTNTLRELAAEVIKGSIAYLHNPAARVECLTLLNSWIATAEETIAAGKNIRRIVARRKHQRT